MSNNNRHFDLLLLLITYHYKFLSELIKRNQALNNVIHFVMPPTFGKPWRIAKGKKFR
jgi:hypothetical protein